MKNHENKARAYPDARELGKLSTFDHKIENGYHCHAYLRNPSVAPRDVFFKIFPILYPNCCCCCCCGLVANVYKQSKRKKRGGKRRRKELGSHLFLTVKETMHLKMGKKNSPLLPSSLIHSFLLKETHARTLSPIKWKLETDYTLFSSLSINTLCLPLSLCAFVTLLVSTQRFLNWGFGERKTWRNREGLLLDLLHTPQCRLSKTKTLASMPSKPRFGSSPISPNLVSSWFSSLSLSLLKFWSLLLYPLPRNCLIKCITVK